MNNQTAKRLPIRASRAPMGYKAFISYSHATDGRLAPALQSSLQRFAKPWNQLRGMRIFLDKASLSANPGLWSTIEAALNQSDYFLLLASPSSAQSFWVQKEVEHWVRLGRAGQLLMVLTEGEIAWTPGQEDFDWNASTALPQVLRGAIRQEPLYTDLRWVKSESQLSLQDPRFTEAVAGLTATLRGISKDDIYGEHVRQHRKVVRLRRIVTAALTFLMVAALGAAIIAFRQRNEAQRQAQIAHGRQLAAQSESARTQRAELLPYSLLLGVESMRMFPSVEADQAIREGLAMLPRHEVAMQHEGPVYAVAVQPGGGRIATVSSDRAVRIWSADGLIEQRLAEHHGEPSPIVFSPDGKVLAMVGQDGAVKIWGAQAASEKIALLRPRGRTLRMAFSPDSGMLAASNVVEGSASNVTVWNAITGDVVRILALERGTGHSQGLAFSSDGRLATVAYSRIRVWDTRTWKELPLPEMPHASLADLRFSPDGRYLAAGGPMGKIWVWESRDPRPKVTLDLGAVKKITFSADGKFLAAGGGAGEARVWETEKWTEVMSVKHEAEIMSLAFSPSGPLLGTASADRTAALWAIPGGQKRASMDHGDRVLDLAFSPDGQRIITASADGSARIWQAEARKEAVEIPGSATDSSMAFAARHQAFVKLAGSSVSIWRMPESRREVIMLPKPVGSAALCANGELAAAGGAGDTVHVWDVATQREIATLAHPGEIDWEEFERRVRKLKISYRDPRATATQRGRAEHRGTIGLPGFSPDGRYLLTTRHDFVARVWDLAARSVVASEPYEFSVTEAAFSPDGRFVVLIKDGKDLAALELPSGRKVLSVGTEGRLLSASVSANGGVLTAVEEMRKEGSDGRVRFWRSSDWNMLPNIDLGREGQEVVLSPDGESVAVGVRSKTVRVLSVQSSKEMARIQSEKEANLVVFSPDSKIVAVAGADQTARLWDLGRSRERAPLMHDEEVTAASFSPDGRYVATGGRMYTRIFSLPTGEELARLVHTEQVQRIQFSPAGGKYVATTGENSTRLWLWQPGDVVAEACRRLSRRISSKQWPSVTGEPLNARIARACPEERTSR